jgi:hypothetical protein
MGDLMSDVIIATNIAFLSFFLWFVLILSDPQESNTWAVVRGGIHGDLVSVEFSEAQWKLFQGTLSLAEVSLSV